LKQNLIKNDNFICPESILTKFANLAGLIDNTIKTTRRIMNGLRPEQLELFGLEMSIKQHLSDFEIRHQLKCEFVSSISKLDINQQQALTFFRILQEAMTNIAKHARAKSVKVELGILEAKLFMEIVDNGIGFDINHSGRTDSYGMIGMKERAFLLKGELTITSKVGEGTRVRIEIPYLC
jgi:two-component system, NarL family, sensor histidine kinase UhpB